MLLYSIIVNMAILPFAAMALLTARDAILPSDRGRYDEVMSTIAPDQSFQFYRSREYIKLDILKWPTGQVRGLYVRVSFHSHVNKVIRREFFRPSADANAYFKQKQEYFEQKQKYSELKQISDKQKMEPIREFLREHWGKTKKIEEE